MFLKSFALVALMLQPAWGYTDPGSGAMLWQVIAGLFAGSLFTLRRLIGQFGRSFSRRGAKGSE